MEKIMAALPPQGDPFSLLEDCLHGFEQFYGTCEEAKTNLRDNEKYELGNWEIPLCENHIKNLKTVLNSLPAKVRPELQRILDKHLEGKFKKMEETGTEVSHLVIAGREIQEKALEILFPKPHREEHKEEAPPRHDTPQPPPSDIEPENIEEPPPYVKEPPVKPME
jgi:hypothetical protein